MKEELAAQSSRRSKRSGALSEREQEIAEMENLSYLLLLLVIAISSLRANFANKLKNLSEFFFTKFKTHHNTFSDEVLFKHKLVTIKVN